MNFLEIIKLAFISLNRNKTRSFLTMLGIIIGIASVVGIVALGQGAYSSVQKEISNIKPYTISVQPKKIERGGFIPKIKDTDVESILRNCPSVNLASTMCLINQKQKFIYGNKNSSAYCLGISKDFFKIEPFEIDKGRYFTSEEMSNGTKVCIIGESIVDDLFGETDPIGKTIRISNMPVKIIGIYKITGYINDEEKRFFVFMPFSLVLKRIIGNKNSFVYYYMSTISSELLDIAKTDIEDFLFMRYKIDRTKDNINSYFDIITNKADIKLLENTLFPIALYLLVVASISLLAAGIGVTNIMLVSVSERTKEIGIRMALGAKTSDIMWQFLTESVFLTSIGGIFGIICGIGVAKVIEIATKYNTVVSFTSVIVSLGFSTYCGIFFGLYPAYKASQLDPIEAFRYE